MEPMERRPLEDDGSSVQSRSRYSDSGRSGRFSAVEGSEGGQGGRSRVSDAGSVAGAPEGHTRKDWNTATKVANIHKEILHLEGQYDFLCERNKTLTEQVMRMRATTIDKSSTGSAKVTKMRFFDMWKQWVQGYRLEHQLEHQTQALDECQQVAKALGVALAEQQEARRKIDQANWGVREDICEVLARSEEIQRQMDMQVKQAEKCKARLKEAEAFIQHTRSDALQLISNADAYERSKRELDRLAREGGCLERRKEKEKENESGPQYNAYEQCAKVRDEANQAMQTMKALLPQPEPESRARTESPPRAGSPTPVAQTQRLPLSPSAQTQRVPLSPLAAVAKALPTSPQGAAHQLPLGAAPQSLPVSPGGLSLGQMRSPGCMSTVVPLGSPQASPMSSPQPRDESFRRLGAWGMQQPGTRQPPPQGQAPWPPPWPQQQQQQQQQQQPQLQQQPGPGHPPADASPPFRGRPTPSPLTEIPGGRGVPRSSSYPSGPMPSGGPPANFARSSSYPLQATSPTSAACRSPAGVLGSPTKSPLSPMQGSRMMPMGGPPMLPRAALQQSGSYPGPPLVPAMPAGGPQAAMSQSPGASPYACSPGGTAMEPWWCVRHIGPDGQELITPLGQ